MLLSFKELVIGLQQSRSSVLLSDGYCAQCGETIVSSLRVNYKAQENNVKQCRMVWEGKKKHCQHGLCCVCERMWQRKGERRF